MGLEFEFTDRYGDGARPDVNTMCLGQCEGMGYVPIDKDDEDEPWNTLWYRAHQEALRGEREITDDGYYFVKCPDCEGSGKR